MRFDKYKAKFNKNYIYLLVITAALVVIMLYNYKMALIGFLAEILLVIFNYTKKVKLNPVLSQFLDFCEHFLKKIPVAAAFIDNDKLIWHNDSYEKIMPDIVQIKNKSLDNQIVQLKGRAYKVFTINADFKNNLYLVFLMDKTEELTEKADMNGENKNMNCMPVIGILQIDNYDEIMQGVDELRKPLLTAEIESILNIWADEIDTCIKKYQNDSYMMFLTGVSLKRAEEEKFTILEEVKKVISENQIPVTLSIGLAVYNISIRKTYQDAYTALDLALGRGGDQAVIKKGEELTYYGGKTQALEKQTRVRARVISHALGRLIEESTNIIILGHKFADMDCLGSSFGIFRACREYGKAAYIVIDTINVTVKSLLENFVNDKDYSKFIIKPSTVKRIVNECSLVVVLDTQSTVYMECPDILNTASRVVIVDHHRKNNNSIEKPIISYLEPYASSTCELVTEILQYMVKDIKLSGLEAEALLAGIMLDTKNFTYRTGVRTFEAASYLKRMGADVAHIRRLFKYDLSSYIQKANIIASSEITDDKIAIAVCPPDYDNPQLLIAQSADELLNIKGVEASFVMTELNGFTYISGRSSDNINVQLILEKLGGGGHLGVAGAKVDKDINTTKKMLEDVIKKYIEEEKQ